MRVIWLIDMFFLFQNNLQKFTSISDLVFEGEKQKTKEIWSVQTARDTHNAIFSQFASWSQWNMQLYKYVYQRCPNVMHCINISKHCVFTGWLPFWSNTDENWYFFQKSKKPYSSIIVFFSYYHHHNNTKKNRSPPIKIE